MNLAELSFIIIVGVMAAFYLIFIRPAANEQKRTQATIRDLQVGDEVITTAGFFARVKSIHTPEHGEVELVLDFENQIEIRALTSAIARRVSTAEERAGRPEGEAKGA
jgi:preprotein translocase YajC subunit